MNYFDIQVDPFNSDAKSYVNAKSTYYSGDFANITAPSSANDIDPRAGTPTRYFVYFPFEIDTTDLAGARPISIRDVTGSIDLVRVTGSPTANQYRVVTEANSEKRNIIEIHSTQAGRVIGFNCYSYRSILTNQLRERHHYISQDGKHGFNETSPDVDAGGLCLNQGTADNKILTMKSMDSGHPFTGDAEADTYVTFGKLNGASGGLLLQAFTDSDRQVLNFRTFLGSTSASDPAITFRSAKWTGTGTATQKYADTEILFRIDNDNLKKLTVYGNGDIETASTQDSSSTSTGSIVTGGGVGIAKKLYVGNLVTIQGNITGGILAKLKNNSASEYSILEIDTTSDSMRPLIKLSRNTVECGSIYSSSSKGVVIDSFNPQSITLQINGVQKASLTNALFEHNTKISTTDTSDSGTKSSNSIYTAGGVGIEKSLRVGESLIIDGGTTAKNISAIGSIAATSDVSCHRFTSDVGYSGQPDKTLDPSLLFFLNRSFTSCQRDICYYGNGAVVFINDLVGNKLVLMDYKTKEYVESSTFNCKVGYGIAAYGGSNVICCNDDDNDYLYNVSLRNSVETQITSVAGKYPVYVGGTSTKYLIYQRISDGYLYKKTTDTLDNGTAVLNANAIPVCYNYYTNEIIYRLTSDDKLYRKVIGSDPSIAGTLLTNVAGINAFVYNYNTMIYQPYELGEYKIGVISPKDGTGGYNWDSLLSAASIMNIGGGDFMYLKYDISGSTDLYIAKINRGE